MRGDLHIHTYASDGKYSPADVVSAAAACGLDFFSVTDHDSILSTPEACSLAAERGIFSVCGIEISAYEGDVKIHTLGYAFDVNSSILGGFLQNLQKNSFKRGEIILSKLAAFGIKLSFDEAMQNREYKNSPLHAMHIARLGAKYGYAQTPFEFYKNFMMPGKVGYCNKFRPTPEEAIEVINAAGGFASLAHPGRIEMSKSDLYSLILRLRGAGLGGIEAVYSSHTESETAYYKKIAAELGLYVTGGSDSHAMDSSRKIGTPYFEADKELAERLKIC